MSSTPSRALGVLILAITIGGEPILATSVRKMDLPELVSTSDAIVQGRVESVEARWEDKLIYTYVALTVDDPLKGGRRRALLIRQLGGRIGALNLGIAGAPHFRTGDEVVAFLRDRRDGTFDIVGLNQGKYDIAGGVAVANVSGVTLMDSKTGSISDAAFDIKTPLEVFKAQIRELVR